MSETKGTGGTCPVTGQNAGDAGTKSARPADRAARRAYKVAPEATLLAGKTGLLGLRRLSRGDILSVIPQAATHLPIISGKVLRRFHFVTDPGGNRQLFKSNFINYPKSPETKGVLAKALKRGLFVIEGEEWRWQRRALNPAFAPRNVARLTPPMTRCAEESSARLSAAPEGPVNISYEMMQTAFDVIVRVTFSGGDGESTVPLDTVNKAIEHYLDKTARVSLLDFLGVPSWVPRPGRVRTHPTLRALKEGADAAIAERRRNPGGANPALLDLLLDAEDPKTGRRMTDAELRDNLITFLIAGHETTALTLSWALYLLALDPATQKRAAKEARAVLGGRAATADDVENLAFIKQVLYETMRLYPPIPVHLRTAAADDEVCGHAVKKGDVMIVPFYALHRNRRLWDQPRKFIPDRFADMSRIDRFAYVPFSVGPRVCIGADFAMQEATIILATLLARHRFRLTDARPPKPKLILTLRPDTDIWLDVKPRRAAGDAAGKPSPANPAKTAGRKAGGKAGRKTGKRAGKRAGKTAGEKL